MAGVILKDVSLEVHCGELTAVLGSKGTGTCKRTQLGWFHPQGRLHGRELTAFLGYKDIVILLSFGDD
jgi:hypothetical protein